MRVSAKELRQSLPLHRGAGVLKVNPSGLIAFEKQDGVITHPNGPSDIAKSLICDPYDEDSECYQLETSIQGKDKLYILNRLDAATSGVLLGTLNPDLAKVIRKLFRVRKVSKVYYALVRGGPQGNSGMWSNPIHRAKQGDKLRALSGGARLAKTLWEVVQRHNGMTLLTLKPITGYTHQLRFQSAQNGCPIVGDRVYGNFAFNKWFKKHHESKRLWLHAHKIHLEYFGESKKMISFEGISELPEDFGPFLESL